ncbi:MAG: hypothetical protein JWQ72_1120 [Polaromonas sp.]|nr:hypothetical protein [Polaromonas sp.]
MLLILWCAGLLTVLAWWVWARTGGVAVAAVAVTLVLAGVAAASGWKNAPTGQLAWDGQLWRWESAGYQTGVAGLQLTVLADFQHFLLLRLDNPARAGWWLLAERRAFPSGWMDLRRAVYSPQRLTISAGWQDQVAAGPDGQNLPGQLP